MVYRKYQRIKRVPNAGGGWRVGENFAGILRTLEALVNDVVSPDPINIDHWPRIGLPRECENVPVFNSQ